MEIYCIHVGNRLLGEMRESAVGFTAAQNPFCRLFIGRLDTRIHLVAQLAQNIECVETSVNIPVWLTQMPGTILFLVLQHALDHCIGFRSGLSHQTKVMRCVKSRGNMVLQISVLLLLADNIFAHPAVDKIRHLLSYGAKEKGKETRSIKG